MGLTYADIKVKNLFKTDKEITARALVDTGAMHLCLPQRLAVQLGYDTEEVSQVTVTLADGNQKKVPRIGSIEILFTTAAGVRSYMSEALVLGEEPLLGVLPLEAMDLIVDPVKQQVTPHPDRPNVAVLHAKGFQVR